MAEYRPRMVVKVVLPPPLADIVLISGLAVKQGVCT